MWLSWIKQYVKSFGNNFGKVTSTIYRSAEPDRSTLAEWKRTYGLQAVLNLRDDVREEERREVEGLELLWYEVPMSDHAAPKREQIDRALGLLRSGIVTLVCCKGGRHRTSLVIACYRHAAQGWDKSEAWKEAEQHGWYGARGHEPLKRWFFDEF